MNKKHSFFYTFFILLFAILQTHAQDTLPKFSLINAGNSRIVIGWTNKYEDVKQISIQRSFDSLKNYKTILTVADPSSLQNGYVDAKATNDKMFYRLYIQLGKGVYLFSDAKRPMKDSSKITTVATIVEDIKNTTGIGSDKIELIAGKDSVAVPGIGIGSSNKPVVFNASLHVFTTKDGYVRVTLPDDDKKYSIRFFDDEDNFLFELKNITERHFKIDKSNFYRAGWFKFELYKGGELTEKHKFYLSKYF